jgi:oligoendopeptidase F
MNISKPTRQFVSSQLEINDWNQIETYFIDLEERDLDSLDNLKEWLVDMSELEAVLEEDLAWRYIKMTIDTRDKKLADSYSKFVSEISPKIAPIQDALNKKMINCPFHKELNDEAHRIFFRSIQSSIELFSEKNIPIQAELDQQSQEFGVISGGQSIEFKGEKHTMQSASKFLQDTDRETRKEVFELMLSRRAEDVQKLNDLFTELTSKRHQVAVNAGFENFRDYKFKALGRFDYTKEDCFNFHDSIQEHIVPIIKNLQLEHKTTLGYESLKPYDSEVDPLGRQPLRPIKNGQDLLNKSIKVFNHIDPYFGDCLKTMEKMGHLDLESKEGKSPGGYNYPLYEIGVPFIFMNSVGTVRDLVTMVHEGGHAVHSFLSRDLQLTGFKNVPSEVAELASMSMELITMEHWDLIIEDKEDLKRAKKEQLSTLLKILPWVAIIDKFQHWIYENPTHTIEERAASWQEINTQFGTGITDWTGYEEGKKWSWQRQLHLYEVPFYYIEYGIAQLGAIGVWKNYKENPTKAIADYKAALQLGYTQTIPEVYKAANITFDFSGDYIKELADFITDEIDAL